MSYLKEAHSYILDYLLPEIRDTLVKGVHQPQVDDVAMRIIRFFDEYVEEVRSHMAFEDDFVFPYIEQLLNGSRNPDFHISDFASKHVSMVSKLDELKGIFIQYCSIPNTRILTQALFNIIACGNEQISHCEIENKLRLSFHTITTYSKNISIKLNIPSSAALTIFAILHNIIDPK